MIISLRQHAPPALHLKTVLTQRAMCSAGHVDQQINQKSIMALLHPETGFLRTLLHVTVGQKNMAYYVLRWKRQES
ncbi:hypothetical protein FocTR4_00015687 [Fusarium oxysporum f. sp. cubense]|uniref:Uncharacterized protein n=1 Tax=Fusarium oxysporum f. sp. cubense TaxID=61366 RepID=A0A5C6SVC9_FUSOC|nr:hypothetical protein FocTR4_00015687 [Fusarium oxysporum f. sp. cubense]